MPRLEVGRDFYTAFERRRSGSEGSLWHRLLMQPHRMVLSKLMVLACQGLKTSFPLKTKTFWKDRLNILYPDGVSINLFKYKIYEAGLTRILMDQLRPGMTFFDVGAHMGYFTLLASRLVGPRGRVHSFEPTPSTFKILQSNIESKANVTVNNAAVWSSRTTIPFNDFGPHFPAYNSAFQPRLDQPIEATQTQVPAVSIDQYAQQTGARPDVIKIDAETAEFEILKGMSHTAKAARPVIVMEVGDYEIEGAVSSRKLIEAVQGHGYKVKELRGDALVDHQLQDHYDVGNLVFLPTKNEGALHRS